MQVARGEHGVHARAVERGGRVEAQEARVGRRRPDDPHPQLAGTVDVVDEAPGAAKQTVVLDPTHGAPNGAPAGLGRRRPSTAVRRLAARAHLAVGSVLVAPAAARTASRIDW
jgi:hypothetical protein